MSGINAGWSSRPASPNQSVGQTFWQKLGFYCRFSSGGFDGYYVSVPLWALAAPSGLPLLVSAIGWRRRAREAGRRRGLCAHCGYDLRATPECCPECGRRPVPAATLPAFAPDALHSPA